MRNASFALLLSFLGLAVAQDLFLAAQTPSQASAADLARARTKTHSGVVAGRSTAEIAAKINKQLQRQALSLKACSSFSHEELNDIIRKMHGEFSPELQEAYANAHQDLRLRRERSLGDYEKRWSREDSAFKQNADSAEALREAKCAEVLMLWVHHLPEKAKKSLKSMALPKLPEFNFERLRQTPAVAARYTSSFSCVTGHNQQSSSTSDHKFPHWPEEAHYHGMGHGSYPFWLGPSGSGGHAPIEVWWSEKQHSEKFYHQSCAMSEAGASKDAPCYHLFVGAQPNPKAYLYTATEDFCCVSSPGSSPTPTPPSPPSPPSPPTPPTPTPPPSPGSCSSCQTDRQNTCSWAPPGKPCMDCMAKASHKDCAVPACANATSRACAQGTLDRSWGVTGARRLQSGPSEKLAPPQSDFMDLMTDSGEMDFKGDFYTGKVKKYIMQLPSTEAVTWFWYLTTPEGLPVEQGEGGLPSPDDKPSDTGSGILIWHEYNTSSFESVTLNSTVFAVPEVCKQTYTSCAFP